jgi:hypothetical protein
MTTYTFRPFTITTKATAASGPDVVVKELPDRALARAARKVIEDRHPRPGMGTDLVSREALLELAYALAAWEDKNGA